MRVQINASFCGCLLTNIRKELNQRLECKCESRGDQTYKGDALGFLALQVIIPMLVSLCSAALYDVLKGSILAKLDRKKAERAIKRLHGKEADTSMSLSSECMEALLIQLSPLGYSESEIIAMYERLRKAAQYEPLVEAASQSPEDA